MFMMTVPHQKRGLVLRKDGKKQFELQHLKRDTKSKKSDKGKSTLGDLCKSAKVALKLVKQPSNIKFKCNQVDKRSRPVTTSKQQCKKFGVEETKDLRSDQNGALIDLAKSLDSSKLRNFKVEVQTGSRFIVKSSEMLRFFQLTEDPLLQNFLKADSCKLIADKYLLAMTFAYFKRAEFSRHEYSQLNFFVALFLANDVEEDEEELKYEILPWALGPTWRRRHRDFMRLRDLLFRRMEYRAIISRRCCDEIMAIEPEHKLWQRNRLPHHSGAIRTYARDPSFGSIYGPSKSPPICLQCDLPSQNTSLDDSSSPHSARNSVSPDWDIFLETGPLRQRKLEENKENVGGCANSQGVCSVTAHTIWDMAEE